VGEIALHCQREEGMLVLGDALINFGSRGFDFLPAKYCSNAKQMRRSLKKLLDIDFERVFFAHGMPILVSGRAQLEALLNKNADAIRP
jgi:glyoxylase-like metal-dependent hydrolase (beta-lactamase superfamily II)